MTLEESISSIEVRISPNIWGFAVSI